MALDIVTSVVLLLVGIAVVVIIHICIAARILGTTQELTGSRSSTIVQRSGTMSEDDIKKLPWYDYKLDQDDDDDDGGDGEEVKTVDCAVCLEVFKGGDRCRLLPYCKHTFHANCIDSWLIKTAVCPICRASVHLGRRCGAESRFPGDVCLELA